MKIRIALMLVLIFTACSTSTKEPSIIHASPNVTITTLSSDFSTELKRIEDGDRRITCYAIEYGNSISISCVKM